MAFRRCWLRKRGAWSKGKRGAAFYCGHSGPSGCIPFASQSAGGYWRPPDGRARRHAGARIGGGARPDCGGCAMHLRCGARAWYEALLTRSDHQSGTDRIAEAARYFGWSDDTLIVNVQGDEPLIEPALIGEVAAHLASRSDSAMATAVHPVTETAEILNPNIVKAVLDARGHALYFSRAPIPWNLQAWPACWNGQYASFPVPHTVYRHIGLYAFRASFLRRFVQLPPAPIETIEALEQLRALWYGERIAVLVTHQAPAPGVDTCADLARVRALFAERDGMA